MEYKSPLMASCVADCVENGWQYQAGEFLWNITPFLKALTITKSFSEEGKVGWKVSTCPFMFVGEISVS